MTAKTHSTAISVCSAWKDATLRISASLSNFDAACLILHGSADKVTDPKLSQALYDEAKSTDKTIRIYQGMQHSLSHGEFEEYKERVFNDIIVWILERCLRMGYQEHLSVIRDQKLKGCICTMDLAAATTATDADALLTYHNEAVLQKEAIWLSSFAVERRWSRKSKRGRRKLARF